MSILGNILTQQRSDIILIVIGTIGLILSMASELLWFATAVPIVLCGIPIVYGAIVGVVTEHDITADVLVSVAIVSSVAIGEYEAAAEISIIMQIGSLLEEATVNRANSGIVALMDMKPELARLITTEGESMVDPDTVGIGDVVRVMPGERMPVDGTVVSGNSSVDTSILTGESIPEDVSEGSCVCCGTMNLFGSVDVRVDRTGEDNTLTRMTKLLENADAGKSRIVRTADRWATWIVVMAFIASALTFFVTRDVYRAVTILVVFCPCALILATPTAIMAASGNLSRRGILVKDGAAIENMSSVDVILTDKTGTLTTGRIGCLGFTSTSDVDGTVLAKLSASVERRSEHPLGRAIAEMVPDAPEADGFEYIPGKGVYGKVEGHTVIVGNRKLMEERCPGNLAHTMESSSTEVRMGHTVVYIGVDGMSSGFAVLSDGIKESSRVAIDGIRELGMRTVMLTGDSADVAKSVRDSLGLDDVIWECLPEEKLSIVERIGSENRTCMVGDGVNDAPSLRRSDVGIAMGAMGSDMAIDAADIVMTDDDLSKIPAIIRMSRRTLVTIKAGIAFSLTLNTIAMIMAAMGLIGPVTGALVHNIGSVMVILGAAMLLRFDCWGGDGNEKDIGNPVPT